MAFDRHNKNKPELEPELLDQTRLPSVFLLPPLRCLTATEQQAGTIPDTQERLIINCMQISLYISLYNETIIDFTQFVSSNYP